MRTDYKKLITDYIAAQNYTAIVEIGQENNAKALRYVQMNIWGDYRNEQRWYALSALEALAAEFATQYDEIYRNVILFRSLYRMNCVLGKEEKLAFAKQKLLSVYNVLCRSLAHVHHLNVIV